MVGAGADLLKAKLSGGYGRPSQNAASRNGSWARPARPSRPPVPVLEVLRPQAGAGTAAPVTFARPPGPGRTGPAHHGGGPGGGGEDHGGFRLGGRPGRGGPRGGGV